MINDQLGHGAGDELLKVIAKRLGQVARSTDCVGRVGGDEFLVICPGVTSVTRARQIGERFVTAMRGFVRIGVQRIDRFASVGVAYAPRGLPTTADPLIAEADQAMYVSNLRGGGHPVMFASDVIVERASQSISDVPES